MKSIFTSLLLICLLHISFAQTTITLQPDGTAGKDAMIDSKRNTSNFGTYDVIPYWAWTNGGTNTNGRSLLDFDLSSIPANATILSATLSLSGVNHGAEGSNTSLTGTNEGFIQRITSSWNETTVNWDNQPTTTSVNQGTILGSNDFNDVLTSDVKNLVNDYRQNPSSSFGFMIRLQTESPYRRIVVASSDNTVATKRPKLQITYKVISGTDSCITIKRLAEETSFTDAMVDNNRATSNFATYDVIPYWAWTNGGNTTIGRSFLKFPLTAIPANAIITSATLTLSSVDHNAEGKNSQLSGNNDGVVSRVTQSWNDFTLNWNNQPNTSTNNTATVPGSANATEVLSADVKNLVKDMLANPTTSFGFMVKLNTEATFRRTVIASFDHATPGLRPKLEVCFSKSSANGIKADFTENVVGLFPNPAGNEFNVTINSPDNTNMQFSITDICGKEVFKSELSIMTGENLFHYNSADLNLTSGVYNVILKTKNSTTVEKLIIRNFAAY